MQDAQQKAAAGDPESWMNYIRQACYDKAEIPIKYTDWEMNHNRRKSQLQERRAAEDLGGRVQPGSGALHSTKEMCVPGESRSGVQTTSMGSYRLELKTIEKIRQRPFLEGQRPGPFRLSSREHQQAFCGD